MNAPSVFCILREGCYDDSPHAPRARQCAVAPDLQEAAHWRGNEAWNEASFIKRFLDPLKTCGFYSYGADWFIMATVCSCGGHPIVTKPVVSHVIENCERASIVGVPGALIPRLHRSHVTGHGARRARMLTVTDPDEKLGIRLN